MAAMKEVRPRRSLSARLLWLTAAFVLLTEVMIFIPSVGRERLDWLRNRITEAHIAALSVAAAPDGMVDTETRDELLRLTGTEAIRLSEPGRSILALEPTNAAPPEGRIDLRTETWLEGVADALSTLVQRRDRLLLVSGESRLSPGVSVQLVVHEAPLARQLRTFAKSIALMALAIAAVPALLVYLSLHWLLVRPMRRITGSIAAFRADPERTPPIDPASLQGRDEIAVAADELAAMQAELRGALWRNARLAALGTAVAKISHDLRGMLATALLVADRLADSAADPSVRRAATTLAGSVEHANELIRDTLGFVREGPPPLSPIRLSLPHLLRDAAISAPGLEIEMDLPPDMVVEADRTQFQRVLGNLLRNAAQAGARKVTVSGTQTAEGATILFADDGPGLPDSIRANLFRPFAAGGRRGGTGLGLAIVHDLMRAHGGDITLVETGRKGTRFRLFLPASGTRADPPEAPAVAALLPRAV